ncbi:hypothetical protein [Agromyces bauzanensis]
MMRKFYVVLARIVAGGVVVQAAAIAFGFGGMLGYIADGGVVDKALVESGGASGAGELGFPIHSIVGGTIMPVLALLLLVISFFVKVRGARMWAAIVLGTVVIQVGVAYSIADLPLLGLVHGANALAVLMTALAASLVVSRRARVGAMEPSSDAVAA